MARPALTAAMATGDGRAEPVTITPARFEAWYAELRAPLRAYLRRLTRDAGGADDLVQETWIRLLTHPPRTLDPSAVRAYVFTIASRLATDAWRRESWIGRWIGPRRRTGSLRETTDDAIESVADASPGPDARVEARREVARSLDGLTRRERALLWLAHVERYEHREIAAILRIRPESVRVLLHRARARAAVALRDAGSPRGGSS